MIKQSDLALAAWKATERTLDAVVTINKIDYKTTDIVSISYDAGGYTGDTFEIGSNYENSITVKFSHLVEGLKPGMAAVAKIGVKTSSGYEYSSLGVFIVSDDIQMDRNNDETTIKAYDQMCLLEGNYVSKLAYPAKMVNVIAEIANLSGVPLNTEDISRLPAQADLPSAITGQTYRNAIGMIAQFYAGFVTFDRDGKLTIRTIAEPDYTLDPSQYEQGGLTKNEAPYTIGGIQCEVTTSTSDSTGQSSETTGTLQAGSTSGSQIKLTNNLMTTDRLQVIWLQIKSVNFYPFSLNWFGNPAIEAGDWLTLQDTKGNKFNVPNNGYTLTFDGSLSAVSKADQTSTSSSNYAWRGQLSQTIADLGGRQGASGNYIYGTDTTEPPYTAKFNDIWYKQNGNKVELWTYERQSDGTGKWMLTVSDSTGEEVRAKVDAASQESAEAVAAANNAVATANTIADTAGFAKDTALKAQADAGTAMTNALQALNDTNGLVDKVTTNTADIDKTAKSLLLKADQTDVDAVAGRVTTAESSLKVMNDQVAQSVTHSELTAQLGGYATQSWTSGQITTSSNAIKSTVSSIKTQIANSAVGTNLLLYAGTFENKWRFSGSGYSSVLDSGSNDYYVHYGVDGHMEWDDIIAQQSLSLEPSTYYTASFYARGNDGGKLVFYLFANASDTTPTDNYTKVTLTSDFKRYTITFRTPVDLSGEKTFLLRNDANLNNAKLYCDVWHPKLERGIVATDFSTNSTDNATVIAVSSVEQTVKGIQTTVSDPVNGLMAKQTLLANQYTSVIGGMTNENLIPYSGYWKDLTGWSLMQLGATDRNINLTKHNFYHNGVDNTLVIGTAQHDTAAAGSKRFAVVANTTYTFSFEGFASGNVIGVNVYFLCRSYGSTKDYDTVHGLFNNLIMSPSQINKYTITFKTGPNDNEGYIRLDDIGSSNGQNSGAYFAELKLELGSNATPYTRNSTSEFIQTQDNIGMMVTKDGVMNAINVSTEGTQIYGTKLHITAATSIDNAVIKSAMIDNLTADKITTGTLNGQNVNVTNLNASHITTGTLTGSNLQINLNTGQVGFQKGRIHSLSNNIDINVDAGYMSVADNQSRVLLKGGSMQFVAPNIFDLQTTPYLNIDNSGGSQGLYGASIVGRDFVSISNNSNNKNMFDVSIGGEEKFAGISFGNALGWRPTKIGGAERGVIISAGSVMPHSYIGGSPSLSVGVDANGSAHGNRILIEAEYVHIPSAVFNTSSNSPNVFIADDGVLTRSTSASKYKTNITRGFSTDYGERLICLPTATWIDKASLARYNDDPSQSVPKLNYGMIAEDLAAAGLEHLVVRNQQGGLEGIQYDRIAVALLPLIKQQQEEIDKLKQKLEVS